MTDVATALWAVPKLAMSDRPQGGGYSRGQLASIVLAKAGPGYSWDGSRPARL
jgi:hypothetical protein